VTTDEASRTVICGGGVIGAAIAYELALRGHRPLIIESDAVASGASGAAAGILTPPPPGGDDPLDELRRVSFGLHAELATALPAASGVDYSYSLTPRVLLATTEEEATAAKAFAGRLAAAGSEGRCVERDELQQLTGWVDEGHRGGVVLEPSAQLDPYRFTLALVTAAERLGAEVLSGRVTSLARDGGRVSGVELEGGRTVDASTVVVAMGPWSAEASGWLGTGVPVEPLKGQIVKVRPSRELAAHSFSHGGNYAITKPGGIVFLGTTEERVGFDRGVTEEARDAILDWGLRFASALRDAELVEQTACLRPLTRDERPMIGAIDGLEGAYVATGHGRQGILMAPATGRAIADLILDGTTDCFDLEPYDPMRFAR
jgi:glycine/D-amino acid oxidase-like deaminating enzyme